MLPYLKTMRDLREDNDLTQQLAELLHTTQSRYSSYERGVSPLPLTSLMVLCRFYNISADCFFGPFKKVVKRLVVWRSAAILESRRYRFDQTEKENKR